MSRFSAIEISVDAQARTLVPSIFQESKIVPAGMLLATRPTVWPTLFTTVMAAKRVDINTAVAQRTMITWDVEVGTLILASSDGMQIGDANRSAGMLADVVVDTFLNFWPTGFDPGTAPITPCMPGDLMTVLTDAGQAAVYLGLIFRIQTIK